MSIEPSGPGSARALIIVDVQNDFCEQGALAVTGGADVASRVAEYVADHHEQYAAIVATADWHVDPGGHFSAEPDYVDTWPPHCLAGSAGADFHPGLDRALPYIESVFRKGAHEAAYSGFEGRARQGDEPLGTWLAARDLGAVDIVGIATDHCVRATALDARRLGFETRVLADLTVGVAPESARAALDELEDAGITVSGRAAPNS